MNKTKKLAFAAVSVVMAGSIAVSLAACGDTGNGGDDNNYQGSAGGGVAASHDVVAANSSYLFGNLAGGLNYVPGSGADVVSYLNTKGMTNFNQMMNEAWIRLYRYYNGTPSTSTGTPQAKLSVADSYGSDMQLRLNICDSDNQNRQITFKQGTISATKQLLDGESYQTNDLKPTWRALSEELGMTFSNAATELSSDNQVKQNLDKLNTFDLVTASSDAIVTQALSDSNTFLDLNLYLDKMPNYKAFLEANPITRLSLTSDTSSGAMYYAPYFDGNDDIEKYELINKIWVEDLLDKGTPASIVTYKDHGESKANGHSATNGYTEELTPLTTETAIIAYMGSQDWEIDVTKEDGVSTEKVYVKYSNAYNAVTDNSTDLGAAYEAAAGAAYDGESGNIIDIMNAAINAKKGEVTGAQLLNMLRAYIDVAYVDADGNKYYETRSDVFNGQNAAWDVDLLAALSRCLVTNNDLLTPDANGKASMENLYAISGRTNTTQRNNDLISLAGELYGVRGLTPRYQYAYINGAGEVVDARTKTATFDAVQNLHAFVEEGLLYLHDNINGTPSAYAENKAQTMMMYDYVQTQTKAGFDQDTSKYNFAPIITPVSQWDVNDDGEKDTTMRFTESWRSVKNTGFAIPRVNVENNPQKLKALLEFIDYMFSNDGQILMTFGSQASGADKLDGWWYATEATDVQLATVAEQVEGSEQYTVKAEYASQYFIYKNKVYVGTSYKGTQIPTLTNATLKLFEGETVQTANGSSIALTQADLNLANTVNNYTDFARGLIGAALPIGNKNQGFEFQCTAQCGLDGAAIVGNGLANGTIKHTTVTIDANNLWYTLVPTTLPYSNTDATAIKTNYTDITTGLFGNGSKIYKNAYLDILYYGYGYMA